MSIYFNQGISNSLNESNPFGENFREVSAQPENFDNENALNLKSNITYGHTNVLKSSSNKELLKLMTLCTSDPMMEKIEHARFIWKRLFVSGHMIMVCSEANGGKTSILTHAAAEMAAKGLDVWYINLDASAADLKGYHEHSQNNNYKLVAPDMHQGRSVADVKNIFEELAASEYDLSNVVFILDTLKKFNDMMNKTNSSEFFTVLRRLTARGVTIIALAHTNKHKDRDDKPVFEGTGDLRNDCDELIYLIPIHNDDGSITVSTDVNKSRAKLMNTSFSIDRDRNIVELDSFVDTKFQANQRKQREDDEPVIAFIQIKLFANGATSLTHIKEDADYEGHKLSRQRLEQVLERYVEGATDTPLWTRSRNHKNGWDYSVLPN